MNYLVKNQVCFKNSKIVSIFHNIKKFHSNNSLFFSHSKGTYFFSIFSSVGNVALQIQSFYFNTLYKSTSCIIQGLILSGHFGDKTNENQGNIMKRKENPAFALKILIFQSNMLCLPKLLSDKETRFVSFRNSHFQVQHSGWQSTISYHLKRSFLQINKAIITAFRMKK